MVFIVQMEFVGKAGESGGGMFVVSILLLIKAVLKYCACFIFVIGM